MNELLSLASELATNNNYRQTNNNYEEKKPDGAYDVILEEISLQQSGQTGTEWFRIVAKVAAGDYTGEKFYIKLFLTDKTIKTTLGKIMSLIEACGYEVDVNMFETYESISEGLQPLVGANIYLSKSTSKSGYINYTFMSTADEEGAF